MMMLPGVQSALRKVGSVLPEGGYPDDGTHDLYAHTLGAAARDPYASVKKDSSSCGEWSESLSTWNSSVAEGCSCMA